MKRGRHEGDDEESFTEDGATRVITDQYEWDVRNTSRIYHDTIHSVTWLRTEGDKVRIKCNGFSDREPTVLVDPTDLHPVRRCSSQSTLSYQVDDKVHLRIPGRGDNIDGHQPFIWIKGTIVGGEYDVRHYDYQTDGYVVERGVTRDRLREPFVVQPSVRSVDGSHPTGDYRVGDRVSIDLSKHAAVHPRLRTYATAWYNDAEVKAFDDGCNYDVYIPELNAKLDVTPELLQPQRPPKIGHQYYIGEEVHVFEVNGKWLWTGVVTDLVDQTFCKVRFHGQKKPFAARYDRMRPATIW